VGDCNGLGAVGQWEKISPLSTLGATGALVPLTNRQVSGTLYLTTSVDGIFKSVDCGGSWTKVNTGRHGDQLELPASNGGVWSAVIDPVDPNTLYAEDGYGGNGNGLWKSTNGGVDWDQMLPTDGSLPLFLARVQIDPTDHLHLIVNFHANCAAPHQPVCFGETKDGGATWNVVDFPPALAGGAAEGTGVVILNATTWIYTNGPFTNFWYTNDSGGSWTAKSPLYGSNSFGSSTSFFQDSNGKYYMAAGPGVLTSPDFANWSLIPNSGAALQQVIGDGTRLFAIEGFYPPAGRPFVLFATYADPQTWSKVDTTGLPLNDGANAADYDPDHHVLYVAIGPDGLWRMVTK
jgi:hypothetical protein